MAEGDVLRITEGATTGSLVREFGRVQAADVDGLPAPQSLADVLAVGNDPDGVPITGAPGSVGIAGGDVVIAGGTDGVGGTSAAITVEGGIVTVQARNEIQRITGEAGISGGTWNLSLITGNTLDIPWDVDATDLLVLIDASPGDIFVTGGPLSSAPFDIEYAGQYANQDIPQLVATSYLTKDQNEIQRITGGGVISGGTWNLGGYGSMLDGWTYDIPWDVNATELQALLYGMATVTGGPLASSSFILESNEYAWGGAVYDYSEIEIDAANLTGTDPTLTPSTIQEGGTGLPATLTVATVQEGVPLDAQGGDIVIAGGNSAGIQGLIKLYDVPLQDPEEYGALYMDGGYLKVSPTHKESFTAGAWSAYRGFQADACIHPTFLADAISTVEQTTGTQWINRYVTEDWTGSCVVYGGGLWSFAGSGGNLVTSEDLIEWSPQSSSFEATPIYSIAYGNGTWVAFGKDTGIAPKLGYSTDGVNWYQATSPFSTSSNASGLVFGDGIFTAIALAAGVTTQVSVSEDGIDWSSVNTVSSFSPSTIYRNSLAYGNGLWAMVSQYGGGIWDVATATDPTGTWTKHNTGMDSVSGNRACIRYGGGLWVVMQNGGRLATSTNGLDWTPHTTPFDDGPSSGIYAIAYSDGLWVASGDNFSEIVGYQTGISNDGITWEIVNGIARGARIAVNDDTWVIASQDGIFTSLSFTGDAVIVD